MSRPFQDKIHVGRRIQRQKNGDIYVLERTTKYDPVTKKTVTIGQRLLGKIVPGSSEIVPTRPKRKPGEKMSKPVTVRQHTGLTDILETIGKDSGIDADIRSSFSKGDAEKILSLARYWLATSGATLPHLESWQIMHPLPYSDGMSEDVCSVLFKCIGQNEESIQKYFSCRAAHLSTNPAIALDSTTISTYSTNQKEARQGFNKDGDGKNTVKLLTLYSLKDSEPIAFAKQPGNIPDVISLENSLSQLSYFNIKKPLIITDNGYYSEKNIMEFTRKNIKFLTLADVDIKWVRKAIDILMDKIKDIDSVCPFDYNISGASTSIMHEFKIRRCRTRNGINAGEIQSFSRRLYVHVFFSQEKKSKDEIAFYETLFSLKQQLENGVEEFTPAAEKKIAKYLTVQRRGRGGKIKVEFNKQAIEEAKKYFGYFVLVGNQPMETFDALKNYRLREKIEEFFGEEKGSFDSRRTRTWHPDNLRGRQFVQFVGLGYYCNLWKKLKNIKESLGQKTVDKSSDEIKQEKKLKTWMEQRSLAQILEWFDCIETTQVQTKYGTIRWSTESIKRDQLLLTKLGVLKTEKF